MAKFIEKLQAVGAGEKPGVKALTFLSDLSMEDRTTLRAEWPNIPVERRRRIVDMLVTMAEDNIELHFRPVLLVALDDTDSLVRTAAIEGLYEDESKLLLDRLISILRTDPDSEVRESAAKALGRFTYLAQCDKLARGANPAHLREALLASTLDASEDSDVQRRSLEALGYLNGDEQVQKLIIDGYRQGGRRAESAVFAMGRNIDTQWEPMVLNELRSEHAGMRYEAARAAGEMVLEDALSLLVPMVEDEDSEVRLAAIWALGQIGGKPAAQALAYALKSDEPSVREAAREAIAEISFSANPMNVL